MPRWPQPSSLDGGDEIKKMDNYIITQPNLHKNQEQEAQKGLLSCTWVS